MKRRNFVHWATYKIASTPIIVQLPSFYRSFCFFLIPPLWTCFILFMWKQWRGKWQTGIRCCRVDCPLPTLRAKPTHDRKTYIVVFFPRTKTYSWVDMLLVLPIEECPLPLVNGTHRKWRKLVKDLNIPRRFNMQNLAVFMINLIDELHIEVGYVLTSFLTPLASVVDTIYMFIRL